MLMRSSNRLLVGKVLKKLFSVALLLGGHACLLCPDLFIHRTHLSQLSVCLDKALRDEARCVITGVEQPDSLACVAV